MGTGTSTTRKKHNDKQHYQTCAICCEDDKTPCEMVAQLTSSSSCCCNYYDSCCKECMVKWIVQKEKETAIMVSSSSSSSNVVAAPAAAAPTCPYCRNSISEQDTLAILGRPFQPAIRRQQQQQQQVRPEEEEEGIDELTLHYLRERARPCPTCGIYIEKTEEGEGGGGGCDKMECLCGCRFCFACGSLNAQSCNCTPATHHFWDNHMNGSSNRNRAPFLAPRDRETGLINLRLHIRRRAKRLRIARKRLERRKRSAEIEREADVEWDVGNYNLCSTTWSGRWVFYSSSRVASIKMLGEMLDGYKIRMERWQISEDKELDELLHSTLADFFAPHRRSSEEAENAWNIRLLFLDDSEKLIERAEIEKHGF